MLTRQVETLGQKILTTIEQFGGFVRFSSSTFFWTLRGLPRANRWRLLFPQLYFVGTRSIPVVCVVGAFMGAVLGVETFDQFQVIGQESRLGGIIGISVVKQIGPVMAAIMIAGRVGGAVSAELGTMRVTEQIDAMRVMGADPYSYLVVPRVLACVIMVPLLTIFSDLLGVFGGWLVVVQGFGVDSHRYWAFSQQFVGNFEVFSGLVKAVVFGLAIGLISCYKGFNCGSGASGVGRAATDAFVTSFLAIIVLNFFLAQFVKNLQRFLYGFGGPSAFG